jgi:hypothetical protein
MAAYFEVDSFAPELQEPETPDETAPAAGVPPAGD